MPAWRVREGLLEEVEQDLWLGVDIWFKYINMMPGRVNWKNKSRTADKCSASKGIIIVELL